MRIIKDLEYASISDWEKHTLDLYLPSEGHGPLIVYVHGGAWRTGDKSEFVDMATNLAKATGNVVAVVNYTLSIAATKDGPVLRRVQHPKHVQDVAQALGYLYVNAKSYGSYAPDRIYLVGHSAGGQITGLLVLRPDLYLNSVDRELSLKEGTLHSAIRGVVGVEGIYDLRSLLEKWPSYRDFVIQGFGPIEDPETPIQDSGPQESDTQNSDLKEDGPDVLIRGSPQGQDVPRGSTFVLPHYAIIHSKQDELVDPDQASNYSSYLEAIAKDKVVLEFGEWGTHDGMLQTAQFTETITKFIRTWDRE